MANMLDLEKDHFGTLNFLELPSSDVLCGSGANTPVPTSANDDFQIGRSLRWLERPRASSLQEKDEVAAAFGRAAHQFACYDGKKSAKATLLVKVGCDLILRIQLSAPRFVQNRWYGSERVLDLVKRSKF
ncbi:hypothetical protein MGG_17832 [Pyricularia oryzae 70-15]|uniref:Uncharacterized protein n=2 Tax=Pyricularia oryzae TaxID=318829 RepID=G4NIE6_PYRO7|nr:uncharacterized protein MGG_17832 [Pyricularia oryzae 70-15]EHA48006.1 hypothetical protein MGG_17832 [Pyricularia oryzae 70-15]ELQ45081.1 hypothetical protein OOU_Y34scaffold00021g21 [Pyricularia oryzae Y34]